MDKKKILMSVQILFCMAVFGCFLVSTSAVADDDHVDRRAHFEHEDLHSNSFMETDNDGNETAGQIAAWLLLVANIPVLLSILIKWSIRLLSLGDKWKNLMTDFNRFQKKHLMVLHYYLNPIILVVIVWHYTASQCQSTSLPEWGLFLLLMTMTLGFLIKFKLCPKAMRRSIYQIHTQPVMIIALTLVLTVGHLIVD